MALSYETGEQSEQFESMQVHDSVIRVPDLSGNSASAALLPIPLETPGAQTVRTPVFTWPKRVSRVFFPGPIGSLVACKEA